MISLKISWFVFFSIFLAQTFSVLLIAAQRSLQSPSHPSPPSRTQTCRGLAESIPAVCGRRRGRTLDKLPVHCGATKQSNPPCSMGVPPGRWLELSREPKPSDSSRRTSGTSVEGLTSSNLRRPPRLSANQRRRTPTELLHLCV